MLTRIALLASVLLFAAGLARAERAVVVELYTSQGCSSCPPADAILGQLADRDDVIALALHVDYWDYIGWKDDFADPAHTARQRAYARAKGKTMIYTPQMVVQGQTHIVGTRPMELSDAIGAHRTGRDAVTVSLRRDGDRVGLIARARGEIPAGSTVELVTYQPKAERDIRRGENAGRTLTYHNIVRSWRRIGTWDGADPYRAAVRVDATTPVVVLIQAPDNGPILGAARLR